MWLTKIGESCFSLRLRQDRRGSEEVGFHELKNPTMQGVGFL